MNYTKQVPVILHKKERICMSSLTKSNYIKLNSYNIQTSFKDDLQMSLKAGASLHIQLFITTNKIIFRSQCNDTIIKMVTQMSCYRKRKWSRNRKKAVSMKALGYRSITELQQCPSTVAEKNIGLLHFILPGFLHSLTISRHQQN